MSLGGPQMMIESVPLREVADALHHTRPFAGTCAAELVELLSGVRMVDRITASAGAELVASGTPLRSYWLVLSGEIRADRPEPDGSQTTVGFARTGEGFGEAPLLTGRAYAHFAIVAVQDSLLVRFSEEDFWTLLASCPEARKVVLADMAQRLQAYQVEALHREKLVSLGTLAAGLMHELHNPGSAAKRAASQLRENMMRLQHLSLRWGAQPKTQAQIECLNSLLDQTMGGCHCPAMSSVEQSDAEELMAAYLESAGVENAFAIAPALVGIGLKEDELACARDTFDGASFSDALNWLEALVSSVTLVRAIEESITRVSDLVVAVKKFAYDERSSNRELDVHDSLQSTLTILGHKLRIKQITVDKGFHASPSVICTHGAALSQVWTNLIDNAMDASPEKGHIEIATWNEASTGAGPGWLAVSITDHGAGIADEVRPHIFEAFFTTKPQGAGTGLGLEIVHRIVTQKFGGSIELKSEPGSTRFIVRLPMNEGEASRT